MKVVDTSRIPLPLDEDPAFAVIGGSGLYDLKVAKLESEFKINTPYGSTSSPIRLVRLTPSSPLVAFIARHGDSHSISPSEVPYRANIFALARLGVRKVISVNACGSLNPNKYPVGHVVIPLQIVDLTRVREGSFYKGLGVVGHLAAADPICRVWASLVESSLAFINPSRSAFGGTEVVVEGPRFSTRAESEYFRKQGFGLINMTLAPEVFLAMEANMCYMSLSHITDVDSWDPGHHVTAEEILARVSSNVKLITKTIMHVADNLGEKTKHQCRIDPKSMLLTPVAEITPSARSRLALLLEE